MSSFEFGDLLGPDDAAPVESINLNGEGGFLIVCDHGGQEIPKKLGELGLPAKNRNAHIAWDIGARDLGLHLSKAFDAPMICGCYSRLVYDLNRYPWDIAAMAEISDGVCVPGNQNLSHPARQRRFNAIAKPYYDAVFQKIENMKADGKTPILVSVHTMTDQLSGGAFRDEAFAVLSDPVDPVSRRFLSALRKATQLKVGDNVPYALETGIDFTVPECTNVTGIPAIMLELRQDLTFDPDTMAKHANEIAEALKDCLDGVAGPKSADTVSRAPV